VLSLWPLVASAVLHLTDSKVCARRRGAARRQRFWESAERLSRHGAVDGVAIVALVSGAGPGGGEALVLESQFRPSQGSYVIEARHCADFPRLPAAQWPGCPRPVSCVLHSPWWPLVPRPARADRAVPQGRTINDWVLHACVSQLQV